VKPLIPVLLAGGLLLVGQACFAEDQWAGPGMNGPIARTELAALGENGRTYETDNRQIYSQLHSCLLFPFGRPK
jgi:hypothetical protein